MSIEQSIGIFMVLFSIQIVRTYLAVFGGHAKPQNKKKVLLWLLFFAFQFYVMESSASHPLVVLLMNILLVSLICQFSYYINIKLTLFLSGILYTVWMLIEVGTNYVLTLTGVTAASYGFLVGTAISKIVMYLSVQILKRYKRTSSLEGLSFKYWSRLFLVPVITIYIIHNTYYLTKTEGRNIFFFITTMLMLLVNYIIFDVYDSLCSQVEIVKKNLAYEQQMELCNKQAMEREIAYQETRQLRHDLMDYLINLAATIHSGHYSEAESKIDHMLNQNQLYRKDISRSGNFVVDALINYKYSAAKALGIELKCNILIPDELPFEGIDICIILGNMLDNAIEAVKHLPLKKRQIEVAVTIIKGILSIVICNEYSGGVMKNEKGQFLTSKSDKANHGLGLNIVQRTVDKYNGELVIDDRNNTFKAMVLLYMAE